MKTITMPPWTPEPLASRMAAIIQILSGDAGEHPDDIPAVLNAWLALAAILDELRTVGLEHADKLAADERQLDGELRQKLGAMGFTFFKPDVPAHEKPFGWAGHFRNEPMLALKAAREELKTFLAVTLPAERAEAESGMRETRGKLARHRIAAGRN